MAKRRVWNQRLEGSVETHGPHIPKRIILHDTESHDAAGTKDILAVVNFWKTQGSGFGSHAIVDEEGNAARLANLDEIVWATQGRNTGSLQIEMIGFASFSKTQWLKRIKQLHKVARIIARWHKTRGIPLKVDVNNGISTHAMQTAYLKIPGGHTDPGPNFPLYMVVMMARYINRMNLV